MTYRETLRYMYAQLPMFQRIGSAAYKANLNNTISLCNSLNNPQKNFKSVHIAGTNGKGSVSHMLASVLQSSGLKVGLYTSPHLKDFRERIKINGAMIPKKTVIDFVDNNRRNFEKIKPSFFEMTVGLAFDYFSKEKVDIAVVETGLGGRLDSTNVVTPILSVITNISFDHQYLLGDTLNKIANEKAGIIKPKIPIIVGETQKDVMGVFSERATKLNSPLFFADKVYSVVKSEFAKNHAKQIFSLKAEKKLYKNLECDLLGLYQRKNVCTVIAAADVLIEKGFSISENQIRIGFSKIIEQTGLKGRWQVLSKSPLCIADTGHNQAGIKQVLLQIKKTPHKKLHFVLGMVNDKDISAILKQLPKDAQYYFCKAKIPRALDQNELALIAGKYKLRGEVFGSVKIAFKTAKLRAKKSDLVFVGGSTFVVAEVV